MREASNSQAWENIDYQPRIPEHLPVSLLRFLHPGLSGLEIGCGKGSVSLFLVRQGLRMIGLDINAKAIATADTRAVEERLSHRVSFRVRDAITEELPGKVDVIVLIRVLTCVADQQLWQRLLDQSYEHLNHSGLLYIHDFVMAPDLDHYRDRYSSGAARGWRVGNFEVHDASGRRMFIAHHHTEGEIANMAAPYKTETLTFHDSLSMNGNHCRMFEFIGRKAASAVPDSPC